MSWRWGAVPPEWTKLARDLTGLVTLEVAGYEIVVELRPELLTRICLPLLACFAASAEALRADTSGRRLMVGLAGIPGGGKSTFAAALDHVARRVLPPGRLAVVGMDGWHLPNAVLDVRQTTDAAGRAIPLRQRKGGPESYDVPALVAALQSLRDGLPARLPVYDRRRHDPVPDAISVSGLAEVVLLEGNYLLHTAPPWDRVGDLLDLRLFLDSDPAEARRNTLARHVRGGLSETEAVRKYEMNDCLNVERVLTTARRADCAVCLGPDPRLLPAG